MASTFSDGEAVRYAGQQGRVVVGAVDTSGRGGIVTESGQVLALGGSPTLLMPVAPAYSLSTPASGTAYFTYLGQLPAVTSFAIARIACAMLVAGVGAQTAEMGVFSTPLGPQSAGGQTLTALFASSVGDFTTLVGGVATTILGGATATSLPAGVHLWAGVRIVMATTQPQIVGATDYARGLLLQLPASGVLSSGNTYAGVLPAQPATFNANVGQHLWVTLG